MFQKSPSEAYGIMMQVHVNGRGMAGVYPCEIAETKVDTVATMARGGRLSAACHDRRGMSRMFSASLEIVLTVAYREAVSRRHAYLTVEHLLYALAHDIDGERILRACGADLGRLRRDLSAYLDDSVEQVRRGHEHDPQQTAAFRRVLQTAVLHVQSAQRQEVHAGDICAAILQQPDTEAARLLTAQGITRLDVLDYISHGTTKAPFVDVSHEPQAGCRRRHWRRRAGHVARSAGRVLRQPHRAGTPGPARPAHRPDRRTAAHHRGPAAAAARTTRCLSAIRASARPHMAEGLALQLVGAEAPER